MLKGIEKDIATLEGIIRVNKYYYRLIVTLIVISWLICNTYDIKKPFGKSWEPEYTYQLAMAHLRYTANETHFLSTGYVSEDSQAWYYAEHPPLLPWWISLWYRLLGVTEVSTRLAGISLSLGSFIVFFFLASKLLGRIGGLIAVIFFGFVPLTLSYNSIPNYSNSQLFFSLVILYLFIKWINKVDLFKIMTLCLVILIGGYMEMSFYLILPVLLIFALFRKQGVTLAIGLNLFGIILASSYFIYVQIITGSVIGHIWKTLLYKSGPKFFMDPNFYFASLEYLLAGVTLPIAILSLFGLGFLMHQIYKHKKITEVNLITLSLFIFTGIGMVVLLPAGFSGHPMSIYYFLVPLCLAATVALTLLPKTIEYSLIFLFLFFSLQQVVAYEKSYNPLWYQLGHKLRSRITSDEVVGSFNADYSLITFYTKNFSLYLSRFLNDYGSFQSFIKSYYPRTVLLSDDISETPTISQEDVDKSRILLTQLGYQKDIKFGPFEFWQRDHIYIPMQTNQTSIDYQEKKIVFDFLDAFDLAKISTLGSTGHVGVWPARIQEQERMVLYQHPPSEVGFTIPMGKLAFKEGEKLLLEGGIGMAEKSWEQKKGDGVLFLIRIKQHNGLINVAYERKIDPKHEVNDRRWHDFLLDITDRIDSNGSLEITFETEPLLNPDYDWAVWSNPRLVILRSKKK